MDLQESERLFGFLLLIVLLLSFVVLLIILLIVIVLVVIILVVIILLIVKLIHSVSPHFLKLLCEGRGNLYRRVNL